MSYIEKGRAKTITKVILWLLVFSFIAAIFVSWGAQHAGIFGRGGVLLTVNGVAIDPTELELNRSFYDYVRGRLVTPENLQEITIWNGAAAQIGGALAGGIYQSVNIDNQAAQNAVGAITLMIGDIILAREAEKAGIRVSNTEIARLLARIYRAQDGSFLGQETVTNDLARFSIGSDREPRFRELLKRHLSARHYVSSIFASVEPELERQVREVYEAQNLTIDFDLVTFDAINYLGQLEYDAEDLRTYLTGHPGEFVIADMIRLDKELFTATLEISDDEIQKYYDENKEDEYREPESRDVRRILVPLAEDADEETVKQANDLVARIYADLTRPGEEFATVARKYSQDPAAQTEEGMIEGVTREEARDQAFVNAVFALKDPGDYNETAARTADGLEIIQLVAVNPGALKPLEEVKDEIRNSLAEDKADEESAVLADQLRSRAATSDDWNELADKTYVIYQTGVIAIEGEDQLFLAGSTLNAIGEPDDIGPLFSTAAGELTNVININDDPSFFRITGAGEQVMEKFDELRPAVVRRYTRVESRKAAKQAAEQFAASAHSLESAEAFEAAATEAGVEAQNVSTNRYQGTFQYGAEVLKSAYAAGAGGVAGPVQRQGMFDVIYVKNIAEVDEEQFAQMQRQIRGQLLNSWMTGQPNLFSMMNLTETDFSELLGAQISYLLTNSNLSINRDMLRRMFGGPEA